jgi:hypothetical protein
MALLKLCNIALNYTIFCGPRSTLNNLCSKKPAYTFHSLRRHCSNRVMKVLNVAEKHDAAKNIAGHLSRGASRKVNIYTMHRTFLTLSLRDSTILSCKFLFFEKLRPSCTYVILISILFWFNICLYLFRNKDKRQIYF